MEILASLITGEKVGGLLLKEKIASFPWEAILSGAFKRNGYTARKITLIWKY